MALPRNQGRVIQQRIGMHAKPQAASLNRRTPAATRRKTGWARAQKHLDSEFGVKVYWTEVAIKEALPL
jgi:hypothetical protein